MNEYRAIARSIADELREHPEFWTQGTYARNSLGVITGLHDGDAVCWCLKAHFIKRGGYYGDFHDEVERITGKGPASFNDDPGRTVQDIIDLCEKVATHE